jgi:hypothetical protein
MARIGSDIQRAAIDAVCALAYWSTVPLIVDNGKHAGVAGTGTLLAADGHYYIVTANHVREEFGGLPLRLPSAPLNGKVFTAGAITVTAIEKYDVALLRLDDPATIETLRAGWRFLGPSNFWPEVELRQALFVLFGYPNASCPREGSNMKGIPLPLVTKPFEGDADGFKYETYDERVDLLLTHDKEFVDANGATGTLPPLQGMSGCSLWAVSQPWEPAAHAPPTGKIWAPGQDARVIAVQTSVKTGEWVRCKRWWTVQKILNHLASGANVEDPSSDARGDGDGPA